MTQPKLSTHDLTKRYGATVALEPTSLRVETGEFLTLLGPSGSGKTTLLMMIAGLAEPSGGRIRLDGADITRTPAYRRDIGVVFQNYALFPHLTVFENVAFPLRMRKMGEAEIGRRVAAALEQVRLPQLAARLPRELSGGQQQRVAFARALVFRPSLVLMDEPLGALDKRLRDELKLEIRTLHRETGVTVVYVTHDQDEAMLLSDRICLMNEARIVEVAPPTQLYEAPATRFGAEFLGESNLLAGEVVPDGILVDGVLLRTSHRERLAAPGRSTFALIRPERIRIAANAPNETALSGIVRGVIDLGVTRRLTVEAGGHALTVIALGGGPVPRVGEVVALAIDPAAVVPLPTDCP